MDIKIGIIALRYALLYAFSIGRNIEINMAILKEDIRQEVDAIKATANFSGSTGILMIIIGVLLIFQLLFTIVSGKIKNEH